ncbi:peptidase [Paenibacillus sp. FSL F4-0122]|uniref:hypothetical protein n=1 Tax=Paenibacillus TaxID=44249 RepID=UPI0003E1C11A|nr:MULTISPECIES: hypothetical protein [Paenibacillus]ETT59685.1 sterol-regulatory element binding protein (SREBP) site 2 protease [Paenibacillus sp. FSL H8-237]
MNAIAATKYPQLIPYIIHEMDVWEEGARYLVHFDNGLQMKVTEKILTIFNCMDGKKSLLEISEQLLEKYEVAPRLEELQYLLEHLLTEKGIVVGSEKIAEHSSAIRFRTPLLNASRLEGCSQPFQHLFSLKGICIFGVLMSIALYNYIINLSLSANKADLGSYLFWIITFFMILFSAIFHEFGHTVAAFKYNVKPRDMGIGLFFLAPVLFVDLSDAWKASRKERVVIDLGGIYFQLWIFIIYELSSIITGSNILFTANHFILLSIISNLNPLLRLDGFWVLTDILGIPNLHTRTFTLVKQGLLGYVCRKRLFREKFRLNIINMSSTYKKVFLAYSSLYLIVFSIALMYMLRFIFSFTSLLHSWNWTNFKGLLIVIVILILHFTILLIKKINRKKENSVDCRTTDSGHPKS